MRFAVRPVPRPHHPGGVDARGTPDRDNPLERLGEVACGTLSMLAGCRHEFGSLLAAERQLEPLAHDVHDLRRDLTLHLIAAHRGHARPASTAAQHWGNAMPEAELLATTRGAEMRFERLQRRLGPWRLAWLEAVVKAAAAAVSTRMDVG